MEGTQSRINPHNVAEGLSYLTAAAMLFGAYRGGLKGLVTVAAAPALAYATGFGATKIKKTKEYGVSIKDMAHRSVPAGLMVLASRVSDKVQAMRAARPEGDNKKT